MALSQAANLIENYLGDKPTSMTQDSEALDPSKTHLAATWQGLKTISMQQVPLPKVTDPNDVLVNVTGSTVCGSDLHLYRGGILQLKKGDVLGHEAMGVVADIGSEVKNVKKGDRVVIAFSVGCGTCEFCKDGLTTMCNNTNKSQLQEELWGDNLSGIQGYSHFLGGFDGCQSETVRVPYGDLNTLAIPDSVPDEKALYLSDIVCTSYHNVVDTGFEKGQTAAIWGAGPIGLHVAQWLTKVFGASRVVILDLVASRLELAAREFGVETIDISKLPSGQDAAGAVRKLFPEGVDVSFDVAGFSYAQSFQHKAMMAVGLETDSPEVLNQALKATKKFGKVGIVADYAAFTNGFNIGALMEKGIKLCGNGQAPVQKYWKMILNDYIIPGKFRPELILTHRFKLEDTAKVYDAFERKVFDSEKDIGLMKCFIETKHSGPRAQGTPELSAVPQ